MNGSQARTYLALLTTGTASIREIAKASNISRPDTYRAVIHLEQTGLVERVITNPTKYKPLPIFDALSILLGRKEKENIELQIKASKLYQNYKENSPEHPLDYNNQYIMIPEGRTFGVKLKKMIENAEKDVCIEFSQKKLLPLLLNDDTFEKVLTRGVNVRVLTEKNPALKMSEGILDFARKHNFEMRYIENPFSISVAICDQKQALMPITAGTDSNESTAVWSNNSNFIELAQNYFENGWAAASQSTRLFDQLFSELIGGFSYNQVVIEPNSNQTRYLLLKANNAFLKTFNLTEEDIGKKLKEPFPKAEKEPNLLSALDDIASGKRAKFEQNLHYANRRFSLLAFSPQKTYYTLVIKELPKKEQSK